MSASGTRLPTAALSSPNSLEVDLGAVAHNTRQLRALVGQRTMFVAVKGNAYGFGVDAISEAVLESGADALGMVSIADAVRLRDRGVTVPILIYPGNLLEPPLVAAIRDYGLTATVTTRNDAVAISSAGSPVKVFVKVNVGLERYGVEPQLAADLARNCLELPNIELDGVYTHLHLDEGAPRAYLDWQFAAFARVLADLSAIAINPRIQMAASSPMIHVMPDESTLLNAVDFGHVVFGLSSHSQRSTPNSQFGLRPAFSSLKSRLTAVRALTRTEWIDEAPFPVGRTRLVGIMPFGRADAIDSLAASRVLVRGRACPLIGLPSMEHQRVDLTAVPAAAVGDEVVIVGRQGPSEITLAEAMSHVGTEREVQYMNRLPASIRRAYVGVA